ncbi:MAG TPA: homoserine kinase [bacterium]|nr:homoserine kinase [bacterium]HQO36928.1 homoserine kinase [bacterium]HQQ00372.1 homoserine kinase [bacterium]
MTAASSSVTVHIPASSANLGPGFDVLGVALTLYSELTVRLSEQAQFHFRGSWDSRWDEIAAGIIRVVEDLFYRECESEPVPLAYDLDNGVPPARGLGSSAVVRAGVLKALNTLHGEPLDTTRLLELIARLEGSPDNASATMLGGLTVSGFVNGRLRYVRFPVSNALRFVALVPTGEVTTDQARSIFPKDISRDAAIGNAGRLALIVTAFAKERYELLQDLFDDVFHQPHREKHYPELRSLTAVTRAAREAGALGAYLSGSGSTMMAVTVQHPGEVGQAMEETFNRENRETGFSCKILQLQCDNNGTILTKMDS